MCVTPRNRQTEKSKVASIFRSAFPLSFFLIFLSLYHLIGVLPNVLEGFGFRNTRVLFAEPLQPSRQFHVS